MNIFVLDMDVETCAQYHNDRHVNKMILESAQMLSMAVRLSGIDCGYKGTNPGHRCNAWVRRSLANWRWLRSLAFALGKEFDWRYRRKRQHKSLDVIETLPEPNIPDLGMTPFHLAMPKRFYREDPVEAYRLYYKVIKRQYKVRSKYGSARLVNHTWQRRGKPHWWWDELQVDMWLAVEDLERVIRRGEMRLKR